jgi:hypothetical protein
MVFDWATTKREARATVFDTFKVAVTYTGPGSPGPVGVHVKLHGKLVTTGDIGANGLVEVIEGINQVVFNVEELAVIGLVPFQNGIIQFPAIYGSVRFRLDAKKPMDGPIDLAWTVVQDR